MKSYDLGIEHRDLTDDQGETVVERSASQIRLKEHVFLPVARLLLSLF